MPPTPEALTVAVSEVDTRVFVVVLEGELDMNTSPDLEPRLQGLRQGEGVTVIVDVSGLAFIDSSGLNALVVGARELQASGGRMVVAGATDRISRVFDIVRLVESVDIEATVDDAIRSRGGTSPSG
jgi:anti-anti-sigma factor